LLLLIRMENSLHRQIERKIRLPDRLQRTRLRLVMATGNEELTKVGNDDVEKTKDVIF